MFSWQHHIFTMKTLHIVSILAALSVLALALSFGFEATVSVLFAAGRPPVRAGDGDAARRCQKIFTFRDGLGSGRGCDAKKT